VGSPAEHRHGRAVPGRRAHPSLAPGTGLDVVESRPTPGHDYLESPAAAVAKLEARSPSILWSVPDDEWRAYVRPALEALRALPEPDRPIPRTSTDRVLVLSKPAD
jgi:hypothetical protein